ncbi:hypothetical protein CHLRE_05g241648v5 [Chlamydomonas reinhardtii]|uniref:Uncharacterized protein n=1 Tax=Chlamydomonas reinhardtii TaxID=3055 RepID=A0A2K3DSN5_CHLRE|nr:uncharacterized protein CHLRE_05g241648v5 [Chlamydomonas reinhardtii]PNW83508.1 hypothetical protein CHLRE_05g241648v5 [Chlamydomonas reinhardtii]
MGKRGRAAPGSPAKRGRAREPAQPPSPVATAPPSKRGKYTLYSERAIWAAAQDLKQQQRDHADGVRKKAPSMHEALRSVAGVPRTTFRHWWNEYGLKECSLEECTARAAGAPWPAPAPAQQPAAAPTPPPQPAPLQQPTAPSPQPPIDVQPGLDGGGMVYVRSPAAAAAVAAAAAAARRRSAAGSGGGDGVTGGGLQQSTRPPRPFDPQPLE